MSEYFFLFVRLGVVILAIFCILDLPKDGPHISGEEKLYQVGDDISLNCTSGKSFPASQLQWFINDQAVRFARQRCLIIIITVECTSYEGRKC